MTVSNIKNISKRTFFGKLKELSILTTIYVTIILIKKFTELTAAYMFLSSGVISVNELFVPTHLPWLIIQILLDISEFIMLIPLKNQITSLLFKTADKESINVSKLSPFQINLKLSLLWIIIKLTHFISLIPFVFSIRASLQLIIKAYESSNGEGYVILSFYCLLFALFFISRYIYVFTGTVVSPFILLQNPDRNIVKTVLLSFKYMHKKRKDFFKFSFGFILNALLSVFIITIPYVMAKYLTWYGIFATDVIKNEKSIRCEI